MTAVEASVIAKDLHINRFAKCGSRGTTGSGTEQTSEDCTRETAEGRPDWTSNGANQGAGFRAGERGCDTAYRTCYRADRATYVGSSVKYLDAS